MSNLIELREKQQEVVTKAREALEQITDDVQESRAQELEQQYDGFMSEYDKLEAQIQRADKMEAAEKRLADAKIPRYDDREDEGIEKKEVKYGEVFERAIRSGVSDMNAEERDMLMSARADIPAEYRAQSTTTTAGGYAVPDEMGPSIEKALAAWGPMWDSNIVRELVTSNGREIQWPTVDDTANTGAIKTENSAVTDDGGADVTFGQKLLNAYVYDTEMVKVPMELLQDSAFDIEVLLRDLFAERLGRKANSVLTTGTGSSQPNGIVTASTAGKSASATAAVTADELIDLLHSVDPAYRQSPLCRWQFNDSTLAAIRKLKDGQSNYLWQMGDVRSGEPSTLLGHPYSINQAMADLGTSNKPILFGDHSKYIVRKVNGFQVLTLRERYAEYFQIGLVGFKRFDGELVNTAAVKHLVNSAT